MSKFDEFTSGVKGGLAPLVADFAGQAKAAVSNGIAAYLQARAVDLKNWTEDLAEGRMTKLEFEDLVASTRSEVEIRLAAVTGIQLARLQRLRDAVINLILDKAFATFVP